MAISRPLTKPVLKKMILKVLHKHKRLGGAYRTYGSGIDTVLSQSLALFFQLDRLTPEEMETAKRAVYELERDDYLKQDPAQPSATFKLLSDKGLRVVEQELDRMKLPSIDIEEFLSRDDLRGKVRDDFLEGDYEAAIFKAFRMVEEHARKKGGQPATAIGVNLMTTIFKPGAAILKHPDAHVPGEEEAIFF